MNVAASITSLFALMCGLANSWFFAAVFGFIAVMLFKSANKVY